MNIREKDKLEESFNSCLFFSAIRLHKSIDKIAVEEFRKVGLSLSYISVLVEIHYKDGITQKKLSQKLQVSPSTITRLINGLIKKEIVRKKIKGKSNHIYLTENGEKIQKEIEIISERLNEKYKEILGEEIQKDLIEKINGYNNAYK